MTYSSNDTFMIATKPPSVVICTYNEDVSQVVVRFFYRPATAHHPLNLGLQLKRKQKHPYVELDTWRRLS